MHRTVKLWDGQDCWDPWDGKDAWDHQDPWDGLELLNLLELLKHPANTCRLDGQDCEAVGPPGWNADRDQSVPAVRRARSGARPGHAGVQRLQGV